MNLKKNLENNPKKNKLFNFFSKNLKYNIFITPKQGGSNKSAWEITEKLIINQLINYEKIKFKNEFWCIVTARKNSKSIKRKNTVKINGKELIKYSFDELSKSKKIVKKIIISTDDPIIKKNCKKI